MAVDDELEALIDERGVRVAERLKLLRLLAEDHGVDQLRAQLEQHENSMRAALEKVREDLA